MQVTAFPSPLRKELSNHLCEVLLEARIILGGMAKSMTLVDARHASVFPFPKLSARLCIDFDVFPKLAVLR